jgi:hypothetical protein
MGENQDFKPAVITHYIATNWGLDVDKLARAYTTCRGTHQTILKHPEWKTKVRHRRPHFLLELGDQMVRPYIIQRASNFSLNKPIRVTMEAIGVNPKLQNPSATTPSIQEGSKRGRCHLCPRTPGRKTGFRFGSCENHSWKRNVIQCFNCTED